MRVQHVLMPDGSESWTVLGDDGRPVPPVERFLAHLHALDRSPTTQRTYATSLKLWLAFLDGIGVALAAQARHDATLRRAEDTLRRLDKKGGPITFRRVAEEACVSRAWLYRQDQPRREIDQLRDTPTSRASIVPAAERATVDSLRQQLRTYRSEIARLRPENQTLREQLARQLGAQRAAANTRPG